jgi:hypothetical protein
MAGEQSLSLHREKLFITRSRGDPPATPNAGNFIIYLFIAPVDFPPNASNLEFRCKDTGSMRFHDTRLTSSSYNRRM